MTATDFLRERVPPLYRRLFRVRHSRCGVATIARLSEGQIRARRAHQRRGLRVRHRRSDGLWRNSDAHISAAGLLRPTGARSGEETSNRLYRRPERRPTDWFGDFFVHRSQTKRERSFLLYAKVQCDETYRACSRTASTSRGRTLCSRSTSPYQARRSQSQRVRPGEFQRTDARRPFSRYEQGERGAARGVGVGRSGNTRIDRR